ncbi:MAG: cation:proton antiporter [Thermoleophilia bacterium]|nr:cation:proton antiporter [Thermoleophilia bacterium]
MRIALAFELEVPEGAVLDFFVLFAVLLAGPIAFRRIGLPGLIGLLIGGWLIGPHGLGLIGAGNQTVPALGQLGLLYLMFVAGLELDLHVLRAYRRAAVLFGLLTFSLPFGAGVAVGWALGWSTAAACLLGSLLASHTLLTYPMLRDGGLSGNPAVASAVGATVLTDTLALVVLAVVAGTSTGSGSTSGVIAQIGVGLVVLLVFGLFVLPRIAAAALSLFGWDRVARYLVAIVSFLLMAILAEVFGIEGIVGAFFAGLALNRLVPNEGPSMERIEFFGAAVFVPVFLVSVGLLLDPAVMLTGRTLGLAALICVACLGGKAAAAWVAGPLMRFAGPQRAALFVLTTPQAAATLAATLIGFDIGLFGVSVVNAVLVLILVSIVVSTLLAQRVVTRIPGGAERSAPLGSKVVLVARPGGPSDAALRIVSLLARPDGGQAELVIVRMRDEAAPAATELAALAQRLSRHGLDATVRSEIHGTPQDGVACAVHADGLSLAVIDEPSHPIAAGPVPVLVLRGAAQAGDRARSAEESDTAGTDGTVAEVARRLAGGVSRRLPGLSPSAPAGHAVVTVRGAVGEVPAAGPDTAGDGVVAIVLEPSPDRLASGR